MCVSILVLHGVGACLFLGGAAMAPVMQLAMARPRRVAMHRGGITKIRGWIFAPDDWKCELSERIYAALKIYISKYVGGSEYRVCTTVMGK